jgi:addiction module RelB/DinJ family antitoxin
MNYMSYEIEVTWDEIAKVWCAVCDDIPLALKGLSFDTLLSKVKMVGDTDTRVSFHIDEDLKVQTEYILNEIGMSLVTGFTIFAKAVVRSGTIPFELAVDKFYLSSNQDELSKRIKEHESGVTAKGQVTVTIDELEKLTVYAPC